MAVTGLGSLPCAGSTAHSITRQVQAQLAWCCGAQAPLCCVPPGDGAQAALHQPITVHPSWHGAVAFPWAHAVKRLGCRSSSAAAETPLLLLLST